MQVLTDTESIAGFCRRLRDDTWITVDTEFIPERTFWPQLCLVQIAGAGDAAVIDALADGVDLGPVFDLMTDRNILKVFHSGRQDLEIFLHLSGSLPHPVFDTQIAAMACGHGEQVSYARIVEAVTGKAIGKGARITDWSKRPLSRNQIAYALEDVTHLRRVYEHLSSMLASKGRETWVGERMAWLNDPQTYRNDVSHAWTRIRKKPRRPRDLAVLREVAAWRERQAQERNLPRRRIITDDALVAIATSRPQSQEALQGVRLVPRGMAGGSRGRQIVQAVNRAMEIGTDALPRPDDSQAARVPLALADLIRTLINARCEEIGVAQALIASSDEIRRFAATPPGDSPLACGWRYDLLGRDIERLRDGTVALSLEKGTLRLVPLP
ncbi:MAG: ribonuclease D [Alphaproteobacteria bacterium]|nr:ribonuclease D [Alphaproteobacteria bacterium]